MTTIQTFAFGPAELMSGVPRTETGENMPLASWYRLIPAVGPECYVAITNHAVYTCDPLGRIHDFFACLYERHALDTHADALRHIGYKLGEQA